MKHYCNISGGVQAADCGILDYFGAKTGYFLQSATLY